jgi:hypothetical protein
MYRAVDAARWNMTHLLQSRSDGSENRMRSLTKIAPITDTTEQMSGSTTDDSRLSDVFSWLSQRMEMSGSRSKDSTCPHSQEMKDRRPPCSGCKQDPGSRLMTAPGHLGIVQKYGMGFERKWEYNGKSEWDPAWREWDRLK